MRAQKKEKTTCLSLPNLACSGTLPYGSAVRHLLSTEGDSGSSMAQHSIVLFCYGAKAIFELARDKAEAARSKAS